MLKVKSIQVKQKKARGLKSSLLLMIFALFLASSCEDENKGGVETFQVKVQLEYPEGYTATAGVSVKLTNTITGVIAEKTTDAAGTAMFDVMTGTYEAAASETRTSGLNVLVFNGIKSGLIIVANETVTLPLSESKTNQLVIKELYNGGCQKNDGSGAFAMDQYVILYNNSNQAASLENVCFAVAFPQNAHGINSFFEDGKLSYEAEGWIPAAFGIWTFKENITLDPGKQIVVNITGAIDNTVTYSNSINYSHSDYYCMYDISVWNHASYYPAPSERIPTSHYLKAYKFAGAAGNAWIFSNNSPAAFIFRTEGITPSELAENTDRTVIHGESNNQVGRKIPVEWIVDGIEVYQKGNSSSKKRLTPTIDNGYVELTNQQGHTLYRNVDKDATEAIASNAGKLVTGYTADPSGIDAEASVKAGARIIYKDTNNSTNDFHERDKASLRD